MREGFPNYLHVSADQLGHGAAVKVEIVTGVAGVAQHMAKAILDVITAAQSQRRSATLILPVGPVDQFPILAELINDRHIDCRNVMLINMDEYLTDDGAWVPLDHPLSFRGFMDRGFYNLLDDSLAPLPENRVFPHPAQCGQLSHIIEQRGGVDACFGGIGINGHVAFNEPPEPGDHCAPDAFAERGTRVLSLSRETRTINSVTVGGEISIVPTRAVTVGMIEILASRSLRFYCNRPWQRAVVRRVLHGPISADCPASLLRTHPDARLTIADFVCEPPDIQLR